MAITRRRRPDQTTIRTLPRIPPQKPQDWPADLYKLLQDILRTLEAEPTITGGVQDNGTDMPLRAQIDFIGTSVTDDLTNDRTVVSIGGGAGAAPVNATYICVSTNGTLTNERTLLAGDGMTSTDNGAGGTFVINVVGGFGLTVSANNIDWNGVTVRKNTGSNTGTRRRLNFIEGANTTLTLADDSGDDEIDVTIAETPTYARELMLMGG